MARQRSPNRDRAKEIYINNNGDITNKSIAELLGEKEKTVSNWKSRDKWESNVVLQTNECSTTNKRGAQKKNQNALGNKGGSAPKGNSNAVTHGFFRKHFPEDVADLAAEIMEKNPIDMLWENITIQYTAIIRAQRLMFVKDQEDITKEIKKEKSSDSSEETEYEIQFAWDKHANFLNAQSRAMSTLSSLIRDFDKLANIDDERRAKLSLMNAQIDKLKADINKEDKDVLRVQIIDDVPQDDDDV
ncbi:phage terminase small subunit [Bacillus cereus group sp. BfR-BA-01451]|uniref:phage terminase small subunit n=1 Tax=Bacillus cereus group sp. BfR-BA-01451 TaxID=2920354 RepID=UPI001F57B680|nr:phage terminase small subunit [Bacillus cereus group sp. BfR-BA-01451]